MNRVLFSITAICLCGIIIGAEGSAQEKKEAELRVWRDNRGNEITARFQRYREGVVYLRSNTRQSVQVQPNQLSKADRDYVVQFLKDDNKEKLALEFERLASSSQAGGSGGSGAASPNGMLPGSATNGPPSSNGGRTKGGRNVPGSGRPPMTTPAGDAPISVGGDPNRTPSPYARSPEAEREDIMVLPNGFNEGVKEGGAFDPFAPSDLRRPDLKNGIPKSSDSEYLGGGSSSVTKSGNSADRATLDPFADLKPVDSGKSKMDMTNNPFESEPTQNYQPPVILNKQDETQAAAPAAGSTESGSSTGLSTQNLILIAIGVVAVMILVMIALLVMVLVKSKNAKPRRSYF